MFRSATFKLTMWYLAIVMVISLVFSAVLYGAATAELSRGLHRESQRISRQFPVFQGDPMLRPGPDYSNGAHRILLRLIGFNLVVLVGAGFASYWLARRTLRPIEEAHEQQKRFTADVSHELRTPLTALRMETEVALLNPKNGKPELRAVLASNLEEISKLEGLINNLLRLTRLEAGELQQQFSPLDTKKLAATAVDQATQAAENRGIALDQDVRSLPLLGDEDSLVQLLVILLDNAIKYSPSGSSVHLTARQSGGAVILEVSDQGIGIERQALEHVFDRFYRSDGPERQAAPGFGLGLSIAKMIVDLHRGTITLTSRLQHGTTATVSLPAAVTPDAPETKKA